LIPAKNGNGINGYNVLNPLYCYEGGKVSMKDLINGGDPVKVERSAIVVNRGWIPAIYKDKTTRP
jgi:cytochrome oxidase assembly protein ShyY1